MKEAKFKINKYHITWACTWGHYISEPYNCIPENTRVLILSYNLISHRDKDDLDHLPNLVYGPPDFYHVHRGQGTRPK